MFCPQCRAEYRPGFTECSGCAVALVDQLPMVAVIPPGDNGKHVWRATVTFLMHQFIATAAVTLSAPLAANVFAEFVRPVGWHISSRNMSQVLTQTPYFPVQIALALLLGWTLGRRLPHKSMVWVWILPFAALCGAFVLYPDHQLFVIGASKYLGNASALSHFLGRGCNVRQLCFDQLYLTMPFYAASSYSLAAWFGRKMAVSGSFDKPALNMNLKRTFLISCVVWLCLGLDVYRQFFSENRPSLFTGVAIVMGVTMAQAAATTLLLVIGSGFVRPKNLSREINVTGDQT